MAIGSKRRKHLAPLDQTLWEWFPFLCVFINKTSFCLFATLSASISQPFAGGFVTAWFEAIVDGFVIAQSGKDDEGFLEPIIYSLWNL